MDLIQAKEKKWLKLLMQLTNKKNKHGNPCPIYNHEAK